MPFDDKPTQNKPVVGQKTDGPAPASNQMSGVNPPQDSPVVVPPPPSPLSPPPTAPIPDKPYTQTPPAPNDNFQGQVSEANPPQKSKSGKKKILAAIAGVLVLTGGMLAGILLVRNTQEIREKAASDNYMECPIGPAENRIIVQFDGHFIRSDKSESDAALGPVGTNIPAGDYKTTLVSFEDHHPAPSDDQPNESWYAILYNSGGSAVTTSSSIDDIPKEQNLLTQIVNDPLTISETVSSVTAYHSAYPDNSPNSLIPVCAVFEQQSSVEASCSDIKAFDSEWTTLTIDSLSNLEVGTLVRFTVSGITNSGGFDKARFTVNGSELGESTDKKPDTEEFFAEYTIPEDVSSFTVDAQIHHQQLDQWF